MRILLFALALVFSLPAFAATESAYDRVMRTNVLRCGYVAVNGYMRRDLQTSELVGPAADVARAMADSMNVKIEWTEETGYADFAQGLSSGRFDAFCGPVSITPARARAAAFTQPYAFLPQFLYVRVDEKRFASSDDLNARDVKAGAIDGEVFQALTRKYFPATQEVSLPNMTAQGQLFIELADGKTDFILHDPFAMLEYDRTNPGRVRRFIDKPMGVNALGYAVAPGEEMLLRLLNVALIYLNQQGSIDDIFSQYGLASDMVYRVSAPYKESAP